MMKNLKFILSLILFIIAFTASTSNISIPLHEDEGTSYCRTNFKNFKVLYNLGDEGKYAYGTTLVEHNPLYFVILAGWKELFGPSSTALRMLSVIFFSFNSVLLFIFLYLRTKKYVASFSITLFYILSPFSIFDSVNIRMYQLYLLLSLLSYLLLEKINSLEKDEKKFYLVWLIVSVAGCMTHIFYYYYLIFQLIFLYIFKRKIFIKNLRITSIFLLPPFVYLFSKVHGILYYHNSLGTDGKFQILTAWIDWLQFYAMGNISQLWYNDSKYDFVSILLSILIIAFLFASSLKKSRKSSAIDNFYLVLIITSSLAYVVMFGLLNFQNAFANHWTFLIPAFMVQMSYGFNYFKDGLFRNIILLFFFFLLLIRPESKDFSEVDKVDKMLKIFKLWEYDKTSQVQILTNSPFFFPCMVESYLKIQSGSDESIPYQVINEINEDDLKTLSHNYLIIAYFAHSDLPLKPFDTQNYIETKRIHLDSFYNLYMLMMKKK